MTKHERDALALAVREYRLTYDNNADRPEGVRHELAREAAKAALTNSFIPLDKFSWVMETIRIAFIDWGLEDENQGGLRPDDD